MKLNIKKAADDLVACHYCDRWGYHGDTETIVLIQNAPDVDDIRIDCNPIDDQDQRDALTQYYGISLSPCYKDGLIFEWDSHTGEYISEGEFSSDTNRKEAETACLIAVIGEEC